MIMSESGGGKKKAKKKPKSTGYKGSHPLISRGDDGDVKVTKKKKSSKPPKSTGYKGSKPVLGGDRKSDGVDKPKKKKSSKPPKTTGYKGSKPKLGGDRNSDKSQDLSKKKETKVKKPKASSTGSGYTGSHPLLGGDRNSDQSSAKKKAKAKKKATSSSYSGAKPSKRNSSKPLINVQPGKAKPTKKKSKPPIVNGYEYGSEAARKNDALLLSKMSPEKRDYYVKKGLPKTTSNELARLTAPKKKTTTTSRPKPTVQQYVNASSSSGDYVVKAGDTLSQISQKYAGSGKPSAYSELAKRNGIKNPDQIKVGQRIKLGIEKKKKRNSAFQ